MQLSSRNCGRCLAHQAQEFFVVPDVVPLVVEIRRHNEQCRAGREAERVPDHRPNDQAAAGRIQQDLFLGLAVVELDGRRTVQTDVSLPAFTMRMIATHRVRGRVVDPEQPLDLERHLATRLAHRQTASLVPLLWELKREAPFH